MVSFSGSDDLRGAQFTDVSVRRARFVRSDLSGAVMRAVEVNGADIDAQWLLDGGSLLVNGVDVVPLVDVSVHGEWVVGVTCAPTDPAHPYPRRLHA